MLSKLQSGLMFCTRCALERVLWCFAAFSVAWATHGLPFIDGAGPGRVVETSERQPCVVGVVVVVSVVIVVSVSSRVLHSDKKWKIIIKKEKSKNKIKEINKRGLQGYSSRDGSTN